MSFIVSRNCNLNQSDRLSKCAASSLASLVDTMIGAVSPRQKRSAVKSTTTAQVKPEQPSKFSQRESTAHIKGKPRPKSHSGKHKPGSRKGSWQRVTTKIAGLKSTSPCRKCQGAQEAFVKMQALCSELTVAAQRATTRAEKAEALSSKLVAKQINQPPAYLRPVPSSWAPRSI